MRRLKGVGIRGAESRRFYLTEADQGDVRCCLSSSRGGAWCELVFWTGARTSVRELRGGGSRASPSSESAYRAGGGIRCRLESRVFDGWRWRSGEIEAPQIYGSQREGVGAVAVSLRLIRSSIAQPDSTSSNALVASADGRVLAILLSVPVEETICLQRHPAQALVAMRLHPTAFQRCIGHLPDARRNVLVDLQGVHCESLCHQKLLHSYLKRRREVVYRRRAWLISPCRVLLYPQRAELKPCDGALQGRRMRLHPPFQEGFHRSSKSLVHVPSPLPSRGS